MPLPPPAPERFWPESCEVCGMAKSTIDREAIERHWARYQVAAAMISTWVQSRTGACPTIVDWGCGTGYGSDLLAAMMEREVIAYEPDPVARRHAAHRYPRLTVVDRPPRASVHGLRIMIEVIEHMDREQAAAAFKGARGVFITTPFCALSNNPHHTHEFANAQEICEFMRGDGFSPVEQRTWHGVTFTDGALGTQYLGLFIGSSVRSARRPRGITPPTTVL